MKLNKESKISLSLALACMAGYGAHSAIDEFNKNRVSPDASPVRKSIDDDPFGQSTLPKLPQNAPAIEELKSDIHKFVEENIHKLEEEIRGLSTAPLTEEQLQQISECIERGKKDLVSEIGESLTGPLTDEQLQQVSEYIEQEKRNLALKLIKSSVSINVHVVDGVVAQGAGTVVRHPSGECYILTASHIFKDKEMGPLDDIKITDFHGNTLEATKIISCDVYDTAVVKISGLGDSVPIEKIGEIHFGEEVLGFGMPFGYESIYSAIVSSAKKQYLTWNDQGRIDLKEADEVKDKFVLEYTQYSAPVDPGHSGGPVFNQNGELVGITSALCEDSRGIAFFISANLAVSIGNQLFSYEKFVTPSLDIMLQELNDEQKEKLSSSLVWEDHLGEKSSFTPACSVAAIGTTNRETGLQVGDIIIKINDDMISSPVDYFKALHCS